MRSDLSVLNGRWSDREVRSGRQSKIRAMAAANTAETLNCSSASQVSEGFDHLSVQDLLDIADEVLGEHAIRDMGLIASAAARPQASAFGEDAYLRVEEKAGALLHSLARNHALVDGNKRLAYEAMRLFLQLNGGDILGTVDEKEAMVLAVATGDMDVPDIDAWLDVHEAKYSR